MEDNKELFAKIKYLISKKKDLVAICKDLNLKDYEIIGLVQLMKQDGELVDYLNGQIIKLKEPQKNNDTYVVPNDMEKIRLLFISDLHFGSKYDRPDIVRYVLDKAQKKNVSGILCFGDLTDGYYQNRQQHVYELKKIGADEQADYFVDTYPKSGIPTYAIGGNHDATHLRNGGYDIGKNIAQRRDDFIYLGMDSADLKIGNLKVRMHHGGGGKAYSLCYKLQRYMETINPYDNMHIVGQGHFHNSFYMNYMNMHGFQVGALLDETPFSRQMGMKNEKAVWWVDVFMDNKGYPSVIQPALETFEGKQKILRKSFNKKKGK